MSDSLSPEEIPFDFQDGFDPLTIAAQTNQLWLNWADLQISIIDPTIAPQSPPIVIPPAPLADGSGQEFVYSIMDYGYLLSTSKAEEMFTVGKSMCKLYYTIEKMIAILIERLQSRGIDTETEVHVAFGGHELAQRKAFESIINLQYNVVVTNFDPGLWGSLYLETAKRLADKGYGYPKEAPRDMYRQGPHPKPSTPTIKS